MRKILFKMLRNRPSIAPSFPWPPRVLVTGASSGLGSQLAISFAGQGAIVLVVARRKSRLDKLCRRLKNGGATAYSLVADLSCPKQTVDLACDIQTRFGGVDILVNNAATYQTRATVAETTTTEWTAVLATNLTAPFFLCRAFAPGMVEQGYGRVVNILSATNDVQRQGAYRVSKVGLEVLTIALAAEMPGSNVAVVGVNPGWMRTEMSTSGRSPAGPAAAITELVKWAPQRLNGKMIDLTWRGPGRKPRYTVRRIRPFG